MSVEEVRQRAVEARTTRQLHAVTIVIGLVVETSNDEALAARQGIESDMVVEPGWRPLGFDIADGAISGLSNCGYEANEANALRAAWAPRLNEHGLFDEVHDALAFRAVTDARVKEHAPFAVYAIWMVALCALALLMGCDDASSQTASAAGRVCSPLDGGKVVADGATADGVRVVVVQVAAAPPRYRVFYGTRERVAERTFESSSNAGTTQGFVFDVDGRTMTAIFANERSGPGSTTRLIDADHRSTAMTNVDPDGGAPGVGLTFLCF